MKRIILFVAAFLVALSCGNDSQQPDNQDSGTNTGTNTGTTTDPGTTDPVTVTFAKGADISWASEMVAGGRKFYKKDGTQAALLDVLKDCGINAIRLRVWVDPYKGWSGKEDVLAMAGQVKSAGMALMVDFHYSDFFADPGRQRIPAAWQADKDNLDKMCQHVADHTKDVLQALKDAGVTVNWIQVGNETRNSILSPTGDLVWANKGSEFAAFIKLYNAGYDAAKAVYPDAYVMPHINNAFDASNNTWWFGQFKAQGGKFDMVALSHYPQSESDPAATNTKAVNYIRQAAATLGVPVMVSEVGVKTPAGEAKAKELLQAFMTAVRQIEQCAGVFYWEPEVDGTWVPAMYKDADAIYKYTGKRETWGAYNMGAFTTGGKPTSVMDCFAD